MDFAWLSSLFFWKMETKVGTALFIVSVGVRTLNLQQYVHHGHITLMTMLFYYCSCNNVNPLRLSTRRLQTTSGLNQTSIQT